MKILISVDTDWCTRNPFQTLHLAERLVRRGHEVRVIDYDIMWKKEKKKGLISKRQIFNVSRVIKDSRIMVIRPPILKIPLLDYFSMLITYNAEINRQVTEFNPDIIIGDAILGTFLAFNRAKKSNFPTIFMSFDVDYKLIPFRFLHPLGKFVESLNIRNADLVISINECLREYDIKMGASPDKTRVIRAGIDFHSFDSNTDGSEIRKHFGFEASDKILFFVGWLYHFSGLKEVAMDLFRINKNYIKLFIVGDGDAYDELYEIKKNHDISGQMILAGKQDYSDLPRFLASADICLLPAYNNEIMRDIVPIKLYEYMAMEKPVVSTYLPGIHKEFGDNHGIIYAKDTNAVLGIAIKLIETNAIDKEGKKAKKFVQNQSWDSITDEFEQTLMTLIAAKNDKIS